MSTAPKAEEIKSFIVVNPGLSNAEVAKKFDTTKKYVANLRAELRKSGGIPKFDPLSKRRSEHPALERESNKVGFPSQDVGIYWVKTEGMSTMVKPSPINMKDVLEAITDEMKKYAPKYQPIKYDKLKEGHLLVIDPADIHIGKLCKAFETGDEYSHSIAIERVKSGVSGILNKAKGFPIDKILLIVGNDMLHVDNAKSTTTSGTFQDTSLMWYDAFIIAQKLLVECIEMLITVAPVHVQYDPSNHDYVSGFMLAQTLAAWFRNSKNITFNISPAHRKYFKYHQNIIGSTHGDGAKDSDLGFLMAHECKEWDNCKHRYFYTHHIHHKRSRDYMSVCVESLRSPSGTDSWHHRNGFSNSPKAVEGFIHSKLHGQIARFTNLF